MGRPEYLLWLHSYHGGTLQLLQTEELMQALCSGVSSSQPLHLLLELSSRMYNIPLVGMLHAHRSQTHSVTKSVAPLVEGPIVDIQHPAVWQQSKQKLKKKIIVSIDDDNEVNNQFKSRFNLDSLI